MMRFFFDFLGVKSHSYDFHGQYFDREEDAANMARLIAMDLGNSETHNWVGSQVEVRCATGQKLISVPVQTAV